MISFQNPFASILADSLGRAPTAARPARHGRAQVRPTFNFRIDGGWSVSRRTVPANPAVADFAGLEFDADIEAFAKQARRELSRVEADFIWLALGVYVADRLSPRHPYGHNGTGYWRRRIHLALPVSDPLLWHRHEQSLRAALAFLTEDDWSFDFLPERARWADVEGQTHFNRFAATPGGWVGLFSGGLDSFAGTVQALQRLSGPALLVSGRTCSRIATGQGEQVAALRPHFANTVEHLGVSYGFGDKHGVGGLESSQRTRAFVHVSMGALAALMNGADQLHLFENGFGALNLACDGAQIGSQSSRGTHPVFLHRMGIFISAVFERPFRVTNPFLFHTKADMLGLPGVSSLSAHFGRTFSCDRFPNYPHKASQCGVCPSCLVRRQSLHAANLPDPATGYTVDVFGARSVWREREMTALIKLSAQAAELAEVLRLSDPWQEIVVRWPDLLRTENELTLPDFSSRVLDLLSRHVREYEAFSANIPALRIAAAA